MTKCKVIYSPPFILLVESEKWKVESGMRKE